ncbi:NADPH-dependent F420 reductase [Nocardiopsis lucentensis]|uniref:NADPH-dependent F420 reductase n=1 Tax=Nocardiopsis lucentensis TaxID=53441 RepID=UPI0019D3A3D1|nr:NAD(P)-binding domain-containing protein [Nocardiopsis lucentensis]
MVSGSPSSRRAPPWVRAGHTVTFGSRAPGRLAEFVDSLGDRARAANWHGAVSGADVVMLVVPHEGVDALVEEVGHLLADRAVIDATNPMTVSAGGRVASALGPGATAGSRTAERLPGVAVVRAFSHVVEELLETRAFSPMPVAMACAGDDARAKAEVADLIGDTGFQPVDLGSLAESAPLDPGGVLFAGLFTEADVRHRVDLVRRAGEAVTAVA